jgi:hypothetical protein
MSRGESVRVQAWFAPKKLGSNQMLPAPPVRIGAEN